MSKRGNIALPGSALAHFGFSFALAFGIIWLIGIPLRDGVALARGMAHAAATGRFAAEMPQWWFYSEGLVATLQPMWLAGAIAAVVAWIVAAYRASVAGRWGLLAILLAAESVAMAVFLYVWLYLPWVACSYTAPMLQRQAAEAPEMLPAIIRFFLLRA